MAANMETPTFEDGKFYIDMNEGHNMVYKYESNKFAYGRKTPYIQYGNLYTPQTNDFNRLTDFKMILINTLRRPTDTCGLIMKELSTVITAEEYQIFIKNSKKNKAFKITLDDIQIFD